MFAKKSGENGITFKPIDDREAGNYEIEVTLTDTNVVAKNKKYSLQVTIQPKVSEGIG